MRATASIEHWPLLLQNPTVECALTARHPPPYTFGHTVRGMPQLHAPSQARVIQLPRAQAVSRRGHQGPPIAEGIRARRLLKAAGADGVHTSDNSGTAAGKYPRAPGARRGCGGSSCCPRHPPQSSEYRYTQRAEQLLPGSWKLDANLATPTPPPSRMPAQVSSLLSL
jgi:hypothetical protein